MATLDTSRYRSGGYPESRRPYAAPAQNARPKASAARNRRARSIAADRAAISRVNIPHRVGAVCAVIGLGYMALIGKLAYVQIVKHKEYVNEAQEMRRHTMLLPASRGIILDRNGTVLVQNEPAATIVVDPNLWYVDLKKGEKAEDRKASAIAQLKMLLPGVDVEDAINKRMEKPIREEDGKLHYRPLDLARRVPLSVGDTIQEAIKKQGIIGVGVFPDSIRKANNGDLAPQILGFTGQEGTGLAGMEMAQNELLHGKDGFMTAEFDKARVPIPGTEYGHREPEPGRDVVLTLDAALQHDVEAALDKVFRSSDAESAVAVVMDPKTGEILAMANRPTYNVNRRDPRLGKGQLNLCVSAPYEPGSTLKVMTMAAAIEEKLITPDTPFYCSGAYTVGKHTIHCSHGAHHGEETVTDVIKNSCNIATAQVAFKLKSDKLYEYEKKFGFGIKTGSGLPGESRGLLAPAEKWSAIQLANVGFGQGISVTPLQLAAAYSTIANDGVYVKPHIIWGKRDQETGELVPEKPFPGEVVVSPATAAAVRGMLKEVVDHGTGDKARLSSWTSGGKTGTAQIAEHGRYNGKYVSSFIGMAPMNDPQFVVLVAVTAPRGAYYGGVVAGPVFKEIAEKALMSRRVAPDKINIADGMEGQGGIPRRKKKTEVTDLRRYAE